MSKLVRFGAFLSLALLIAACSNTTGPTPESAAPGVPTGPVTLDDQFAEVAVKAPSFGGMFYDDSGVLNVYMVEPKGELSTQAAKAQRAAVTSAITSVFGKEVLLPQVGRDMATGKALKPQSREADFKVLPAKYDFSQLRELYRSMRGIFGTAGVVYTDIDEMKNRLTVGVENEAARARVKAELAKLGVPLGAVVLEKTAPIRPAHTLRETVRATQGGLQINNYKSGKWWNCTLGFNAKRNGVWGFVTNSHCTNNQGNVESTKFYQTFSNQIGTEVADLWYYWSTTGQYVANRWCPAYRYCRWSDSAFVRYNSGVSYRLGLARLNSSSRYAELESQADVNISHSYPAHQVAAEFASEYMAGHTVEKVGRTTGWTYGAVTKTCADTYQGSQYYFFCQSFVDTGTAGGDSGSPVFRSYSNGTARLYGILWGGPYNQYTNAPGTYFIFSPMRNVEYELGYLTTY